MGGRGCVDAGVCVCCCFFHSTRVLNYVVSYLRLGGTRARARVCEVGQIHRRCGGKGFSDLSSGGASTRYPPCHSVINPSRQLRRIQCKCHKIKHGPLIFPELRGILCNFYYYYYNNYHYHYYLFFFS